MKIINDKDDDLGNLKLTIEERAEHYCTAVWLKSPFNADVWDCHFDNKNKIQINFCIQLDSENRLTDMKHLELLETFKCWIILQTHSDTTGGKILGPESSMRRTIMALNIIDYFILNAQNLQLIKFGLKVITYNDICSFFLSLSSSSEIAISLYQWPNCVSTFLREKIKGLSKEQIKSVLETVPSIANDIPSYKDRYLDLSEADIVNSRIWLWINNYYINYIECDYKYSLNTKSFSALLYKNTLWGFTHKPVPEELKFEPLDRYSREYLSVPVRVNLNDQLSKKKLSRYFQTLSSLGILEEFNLSVPIGALDSLNFRSIAQNLTLKSIGRFRTLPLEVVLMSLRNAIEFFLEYGNDLVTSYLALAKAAKVSKQTCLIYSNTHDIEDLLTPKILELGVKTWTLDTSCKCFQMNGVRLTREEYFKLFRANFGLWELIRVMYGAVLVCVGTLMARRAGELSDLIAGDCLDTTGQHLIFYNRKSGFNGLRERIARPIPEIAVKMIRQIERLQSGLIELGLLERKSYLFCYPSQKGSSLITYVKNNPNLDYFCDYFQLPLDQDGCRYYIRQHQLRRFFAMLFFWGNSFGGMDILRWFLGHTDVEHLYHYITESTPGEVLRSVKAQYTSEKIQKGEATEALSALIEEHFCTSDFSVINISELDGYLEDLIDDGSIEVEPEYFNTPEGKSYRILIKICRAPA